jgi:threonine dehydrogenase-like Zn-dependent dehydrogenase
MMDILAVCLHVAETGGIQAARPVLCIGAGPAGNGIAHFARALGASRAVLIDPSTTARDVALRQSLGDVIDPTGMSTEEITTALRKFAPAGFGTVFDTVGSHESLSLGIANLGKAATLVNLAVHDEPVPINFLQLGGERRITTSCNFEVGDYPRALAFLEAGRVSVKEWITPIGLDEVPDWFRRIHENATEKGAFKLVVDPWRSKVG